MTAVTAEEPADHNTVGAAVAAGAAAAAAWALVVVVAVLLAGLVPADSSSVLEVCLQATLLT